MRTILGTIPTASKRRSFSPRIGRLRTASVALLLVTALSLTLSGCGGGPDVAGDWSGRMSSEGESFLVDLHLNPPENERLSGYGSFSDEESSGQFEVVSGSVREDGSVRFLADAPAVQAEFVGEVSGDTLEGAFVFSGEPEDITLTREDR